MEKKLGVFFTIVARPLFINTSLSIIPSSNPSAHVQTKLFFPSFSLHYTYSCFYLSISRTRYFLPSIAPASISFTSLALLCMLLVLFLGETVMQYVACMLSINWHVCN